MLFGLSDKLILIGVGTAVLFVCLLLFGIHEREIGYNKCVAAQERAQAVYKQKAKKVTTEVITKYVHDIQVVHEKGNTIIKKVPVYVTVKDDAACTINNGFVSLWNSSNTLRIPKSAASTNGSPSSVALSDVAAQHVREANICHGTETQLIALQDWVRLQRQVK